MTYICFTNFQFPIFFALFSLKSQQNLFVNSISDTDTLVILSLGWRGIRNKNMKRRDNISRAIFDRVWYVKKKA